MYCVIAEHQDSHEQVVHTHVCPDTGLSSLHPHEKQFGDNHEAILALRMLYSSVVQNERPSYSEFVETMDAGVRQSLKPMHVLHFWKRAGGFSDTEPWMVVFAVDEVQAVAHVQPFA